MKSMKELINESILLNESSINAKRWISSTAKKFNWDYEKTKDYISSIDWAKYADSRRMSNNVFGNFMNTIDSIIYDEESFNKFVKSEQNKILKQEKVAEKASSARVAALESQFGQLINSGTKVVFNNRNGKKEVFYSVSINKDGHLVFTEE